jgi:hypothetical protein
MKKHWRSFYKRIILTYLFILLKNAAKVRIECLRIV